MSLHIKIKCMYSHPRKKKREHFNHQIAGEENENNHSTGYCVFFEFTLKKKKLRDNLHNKIVPDCEMFNKYT